MSDVMKKMYHSAHKQMSSCMCRILVIILFGYVGHSICYTLARCKLLLVPGVHLQCFALHCTLLLDNANETDRSH